MAILNSFVNDIFERIATEASSASDPLWPFLLILKLHFRARCLLQEVHHLITRNPDRRPPHPPWRARQACYLGRHQVRDEVLVRGCQVEAPSSLYFYYLFRLLLGICVSVSLYFSNSHFSAEYPNLMKVTGWLCPRGVSPHSRNIRLTRSSGVLDGLSLAIAVLTRRARPLDFLPLSRQRPGGPT